MSHRALGEQFLGLEELKNLPTHDYADTTVQHVLPHMEEHAEGIDEDDEWQHGGPRQHVEALAADIKENGLREPLVVNQTADGRRHLADGHHRALAAIQLGLPRVPVRVRNV